MNTFKKIFFWILARIGEFLRYFYIILPFETYGRVRDLINPRLYSRDRRILTKSNGEIAHDTNMFAIFVIFTQSEIPVYTKTAIDELNALGVNIIFVSNGKLPSGAAEELKRNGCMLIERVNLGRDFGAYKDGLSILRETFDQVDRVIFMNDSIYYFPDGLSNVFKKLISDHQFVGLTEVFEHHYHVQSYLLSVGKEVLENKKFNEYWENYLPISTRRWSIHKGEVGLTRVITRKAGFSPYIICNAGMLRSHLEEIKIAEMPDVIELLPSLFKKDAMTRYRALLDRRTRDFAVSRVLSAIGGADAVRGLSENPAIVIAEGKVQGAPESQSVLAEEVQKEVARVKGVLSHLDTIDDEDFVDFLIDFIATRNQTHWGGALFVKFLNIPILKRDVVYRESYGFEEFTEVIDLLELPFKEEVSSDLRRKGLSKYYTGYKYILYKSGTI